MMKHARHDEKLIHCYEYGSQMKRYMCTTHTCFESRCYSLSLFHTSDHVYVLSSMSSFFFSLSSQKLMTIRIFWPWNKRKENTGVIVVVFSQNFVCVCVFLNFVFTENCSLPLLKYYKIGRHAHWHIMIWSITPNWNRKCNLLLSYTCLCVCARIKMETLLDFCQTFDGSSPSFKW